MIIRLSNPNRVDKSDAIRHVYKLPAIATQHYLKTNETTNSFTFCLDIFTK
jgi:hypothetical protein